MSLLLGMVNVDGAPIDRVAFAALCQTLARFPYVAVRRQESRSAAIICCQTLNTPEAANDLDEGHASESAGELLFAASGRIDNRTDIENSLHPSCSKSNSDTTLMRACYLRWQEGAADRLSGDWAFVAYHPKENRLVLARDQAGYTAIYYYFDGRTLLFSTLIEPLLQHLRGALRVNTDMLISMQMMRKVEGVDASQTYYKDICRLPPAHRLSLASGRIWLERYWYPEAILVNSRHTLKTCAAELRELLENAVRARLRSDGPIASTLSGGFDSSTVTCLAAGILRQTGQVLQTYSHVPLYQASGQIGRHRIGNERPYIEATVGRNRNVNPMFLDSAGISPLTGIIRMLEIVHEPIFGAINLYWLYDIFSHAQDQGVGTLLTGEGGNATISFSGLESELAWGRLIRHQGFGSAVRKKILRPLLQSYVGPTLRSLARPFSVPRFSYLRPDWLKNQRVSFDKFPYDQYPRSAQDYALRILLPGENPRCFLGGVFGQHFGFEMRDPTMDLKVIEYCLSIPNNIHFDEVNTGKNLIRTMMKDILPQQILTASGKGLQSADIGMRVAHSAAELDAVLERLRGSQSVRSIMNLDQMHQDWQGIKGIQDNRYRVHVVGHFLRALMVCLFLYRVENPSEAISDSV